MSTDTARDSDTADSDGQDHHVPTEDEYVDETATLRWVELEDATGSFQVREIPPLKLLRDMMDFGVEGMMSGGMDDEELREMVETGRFADFLEETVLPNIEQPACYWGDHGAGDFDLAALTANDLMTVIFGLTGRDPSEVEADAEAEMGESFPE